MGKNIYATPRDRNKWQNQTKESNASFPKADNKAERLAKLKERLKKNQ